MGASSVPVSFSAVSNATTRDIESEIEVSQEGKVREIVMDNVNSRLKVQGKAERIITTLKFDKEKVEASLNKEKIQTLQLKEELAEIDTRNTELYTIGYGEEGEHICMAYKKNRWVSLRHEALTEEGSMCLFHKSLKALFTEDHVIMTESGLNILEQYNHGSVPLQLENVEKLINLDFDWLIPGHGRRVHFKDGEEKLTVKFSKWNFF